MRSLDCDNMCIISICTTWREEDPNETSTWIYRKNPRPLGALYPFDYKCTCVMMHYLTITDKICDSSLRLTTPSRSWENVWPDLRSDLRPEFGQGARPILTTCLTIFDCQSQMLAHWDNTFTVNRSVRSWERDKMRIRFPLMFGGSLWC